MARILNQLHFEVVSVVLRTSSMELADRLLQAKSMEIIIIGLHTQSATTTTTTTMKRSICNLWDLKAALAILPTRYKLIFYQLARRFNWAT